MDGLFTYYRTGGSYHPLVDIALFHYQFETIHPYGDGNGRLGRLLITLQLYDADLLERPNLYLSEYLNRNKTTYVERMEGVRFHGEWEAWLSFFIEGIARQAHESVERTRALADLRREYEHEYGESVHQEPARSDALRAALHHEQDCPTIIRHRAIHSLTSNQRTRQRRHP